MALKPSMTRAEIEAWTPGGIIKQEGNDIQVHGPVGSGPLWVDANDKSITPHLIKEPFWESWITSWHTKHLNEYDTYIDIGANSGYFSVLASYYGLSVFSVEANPRYVELLKRTQKDVDISIWPVAIADYRGPIKLSVPDELHGGSSIMNTAAKATKFIDVHACTLDQFYPLTGHNVLIKMDIEGAEELAFNGGQEWLSEHNADIVMEYTPRAYTGEFWGNLETYGAISRVDFDGNEQPVTEEQANAEPDWLTIVVRKHK